MSSVCLLRVEAVGLANLRQYQFCSRGVRFPCLLLDAGVLYHPRVDAFHGSRGNGVSSRTNTRR